MKNPLFIVVAVVIVLVFAVNMTTYQVDFTEKAVVATFGRVSDTTGVQEEPGLKFKLPSPLQTVTLYDRRSRLIEVTNEQVATTDGSLVANAFVTWRVSDPVVFYGTYNRGGGVGSDPARQYEAAEETLETQLRNALRSTVSDYALGDLFSEDGSSALPELEAEITRRLRGWAGTDGAGGVEVQMVGISRLVFPDRVSEQVIRRMSEFRDSLGERATQEGEAEAAAITSRADADRQRIISFAETLASRLRSEGDRDAARWYGRLNENPELAAFLASVRAWTEDGVGRTLTLVLPLSSFGGEFFSPEYRERLIEAQERRNGDAERDGNRREEGAVE